MEDEFKYKELVGHHDPMSDKKDESQSIVSKTKRAAIRSTYDLDSRSVFKQAENKYKTEDKPMRDAASGSQDDYLSALIGGLKT